MYGIDSAGSEFRPTAVFCEHGIEHSGSIRGK
jgi:hypothetical protein